MEAYRQSIQTEIADIRAKLATTIVACDTRLDGFAVGSLADLEVEFAAATKADAPGKNDKVCAALSDVREDLSQCVQMLQKMTRWIHLMVPAIEDGNNFGVGVQGEILKMITDRSNHLNGLFAALPGYHKDRAAAWKDLAAAKGSKTNTTSTKKETENEEPPKTTVTDETKSVAGISAANHPDALAHIVALDVQTYFHLYHSLGLVRDTYLIVGDTIEKNLSKIESPKGGSGGGGRGGMSMY